MFIIRRRDVFFFTQRRRSVTSDHLSGYRRRGYPPSNVCILVLSVGKSFRNQNISHRARAALRDFQANEFSTQFNVYPSNLCSFFVWIPIVFWRFPAYDRRWNRGSCRILSSRAVKSTTSMVVKNSEKCSEESKWTEEQEPNTFLLGEDRNTQPGIVRQNRRKSSKSILWTQRSLTELFSIRYILWVY